MVFKALFFAGALSFSLLSGNLVEYFKPALGKSESHHMKNIDFIYTINLDQRPQKYEHCVSQLAPYGILPYRFSAVNGWELPLEAIGTLGVEYAPYMRKGLWGTYYPLEQTGSPCHEIIETVGRKYFCHCLSRGAIGIVLSHLSVLQDAYDSGYQRIWVTEDDIQVIQDPRLLSGLIEKLNGMLGASNWDILFTDQDTKNNKGEYVPCRGYAQRPNFTPYKPERFAQEPTKVGSDFKRVNARYGAYSMIVQRSGMKKILDFIKTYKVFLPYDMEFYLPSDIKMYSTSYDIVSTLPNALSDNGGPNYIQVNQKENEYELRQST